MHSNNGVFAKTDTFIEYTKTLCDIARDYEKTLVLNCEKDNTLETQQEEEREF